MVTAGPCEPDNADHGKQAGDDRDGKGYSGPGGYIGDDRYRTPGSPPDAEEIVPPRVSISMSLIFPSAHSSLLKRELFGKKSIYLFIY
jgi:hypothetical protein